MELLKQHIEAIIFTSEKPVTIAEIIECLNKLDEAFYETTVIESLILSMANKYQSDDFAFELIETGGGFQFLTKPAYLETVSSFLNLRSRKRLSTASMETLAIIAYKQPVGKLDIEQIRGVNCDYTVNKLLEKDLIIISGREESPGRPLLYSVSDSFLDYFGIQSISDLPKPRDLQMGNDNVAGKFEGSDPNELNN